MEIYDCHNFQSLDLYTYFLINCLQNGFGDTSNIFGSDFVEACNEMFFWLTFAKCNQLLENIYHLLEIRDTEGLLLSAVLKEAHIFLHNLIVLFF